MTTETNTFIAEDTTSDSATRPSWIRICCSGAAMGLADAVPGVSGGTIALIAGIYQHLIDSIHNVISGMVRLIQPHGRRQFWCGLSFLVPLYACAAIAMVAAILLLVGAKPDATDADSLWAALETAPGLLINPSSAPIVFAYFFGLVIASIPEPWRERRTSKPIDWLLAAGCAALSAGLAMSPAMSGSTHPIVVLAAGSIAVSVMLLPGISGSLALLVIGMYQPVASAVHERDLQTVSFFIAGMTIGALLFVPLLRLWLHRFHDRTMASLSGLMAGSLVALWPWKAHYFPEGIPLLGPMHPMIPHGHWWWVVLAMVAGAGTIFVITRTCRPHNAST